MRFGLRQAHIDVKDGFRTFAVKSTNDRTADNADGLCARTVSGWLKPGAAGKLHSNGPETSHSLTIKLDQSDGTVLCEVTTNQNAMRWQIKPCGESIQVDGKCHDGPNRSTGNSSRNNT